MPEPHTVMVQAGKGLRLRDLLLAKGMEFPCGGDGTCGQCRVKVLQGEVLATSAMGVALSGAELREGWRLGCLAEADGPVVLEVAQWHSVGGRGEAGAGMRILSDTASVPVQPREGWGAVVDVGTTTVVAQTVDLASGDVLATASALNTQVRWGADVMSRIRNDLAYPGTLGQAIREQVGALLAETCAGKPLREVLLVGNTAMHHFFCGCAVDSLATAPFRTPFLEACCFTPNELGWPLPVAEQVTFLPNLGGFVGSDVLAALAAAGFLALVADEGSVPHALLDLGTNGEIALAARGRILCASTAAGPAFEAGNIRHGMRAVAGAIHRVACADGAIHCEVLGGGIAKGLCGSGLVDAIASGLDCGMVLPQGRLRAGLKELELQDGVVISQKDIRELQLAKAAIASGLTLISTLAGVTPKYLHLAGAFGNYLREHSARRIGLLPDIHCEVLPGGNAALRGARLLLLTHVTRQQMLQEYRQRTSHVELAAVTGFQDAFVDALAFPVNGAEQNL